MKDKIDYITYIGNIRAYASENDAEAAAADAVRLDAAIVEQASPKNIMSIVMGAKSHLKATSIPWEAMHSLSERFRRWAMN